MNLFLVQVPKEVHDIHRANVAVAVVVVELEGLSKGSRLVITTDLLNDIEETYNFNVLTLCPIDRLDKEAEESDC